MDDEWGRLRQPAAESEVFWYGIDQKPPGPGRVVRALNIQSSFDGLRFDVEAGDKRFTLESPLVGRINVYNILLACATALSYGINGGSNSEGRETALRACRDGLSVSMKDNPLWLLSITRIPTTR